MFGIKFFKSNVNESIHLLVHAFATTHVSQYNALCAPRHRRRHPVSNRPSLEPRSLPYLRSSMSDQPEGVLHVLDQLKAMQQIHKMNECDTSGWRTWL